MQQSVSKGKRLPSLFSTTDESYHANLRRSVNNAFSMSQLVQYEPAVTETVEVFLNQTDKLYAKPGQVCDFAQWLQYFAFDVSSLRELTEGCRSYHLAGHRANHLQQAAWLRGEKRRHRRYGRISRKVIFLRCTGKYRNQKKSARVEVADYSSLGWANALA